MKNGRLYFIIPICVILFLICFIYAKRNDILNAYIQEKLENFEKGSSAKISYDNLNLNGISNLEIANFKIISEEKDTLLQIKDIKIKFNVFKFFTGKHQINGLQVRETNLHLSKINGKKNYVSLFKREKKDTSKDNSEKSEHRNKLSDYYQIISSIVPDNILVTELNIILTNETDHTHLYLPEVTIHKNKLYSQMLVKEDSQNNTSNQYCIIEGTFGDDLEENCNFKIYPVNENPMFVPFMKEKFDTEISFDTVSFSTSLEKDDRDTFLLKGSMSCKNLCIQNFRLAKNKIVCKNSSLNYSVKYATNSFELDSCSILKINNMEVHPYIKYSKQDTFPCLVINLHQDTFPSENLFNSFPVICSNLEGIQTTGKLTYDFHFKIDTREIDSLEFQSSLTSNDFKLLKLGKTDFRKANGSMLYHVYEDSLELFSYELGEDNPNFRKLNDISPYLKSAVMFSEDGNFFYHKGFIEDAIRASIIKNIKEKRFARGGSTISMQLVKNLWLSREKTLSRKFEEALIVWLIENQRLISKERMYEIYLNIIEWGPRIYGANQAAHFYFKKEASQLKPEEAIFMASIIPRPKKFMWSFDKTNNLKPFLNSYYTLIGKKLLRHEIITEDEFEHLQPKVKISGDALNYLSAVPDSLAVDDNITENEFDSEYLGRLNSLEETESNETIQNQSDTEH